jgi:DNA-binding transcriptional LysR family regulator
MDLKQIKGFIAVAEAMHFGRAAETLHMAPTALSRLVRTLEDDIGVRLLNRTTRAVTLTRAGLGFLDDAKAILSRTEDAARNAREIADGGGMMLRIGAIDAASASFLPAAVVELRHAHPSVDVRLTETMTAPQLQMLRTGRLDLALIRPPVSGGEFPFETLRQERLIALLPQRHALAGHSVIHLADIVDDLVMIPAKRARPYAYDLVMAYFAAEGLVPRKLQETTEKPAILAMVASGMGVALVPDWVRSLSREGVCFRPLAGVLLEPPPAGALVGMSWRPQQRHVVRDAFLEMLRKQAAFFNPSFSVESSITRIAAGDKSR